MKFPAMNKWACSFDLEFKSMSNEHEHQKSENFAHEHVNELYLWVKISMSMVFRDFNLSILVRWSHFQVELPIEQVNFKILIHFGASFEKKIKALCQKTTPKSLKKGIKCKICSFDAHGYFFMSKWACMSKWAWAMRWALFLSVWWIPYTISMLCLASI